MEAGIKERAEVIARASLYHVKDKAGRSVYAHSIRVSNLCGSYTTQVVALLHDVVEDSPLVLEDLEILFPSKIVQHVGHLTRRHGETYSSYIERLCEEGSFVARMVKLADLQDHLNTPLDIPVSLRQRYVRAYEKIEKSLKNVLTV